MAYKIYLMTSKLLLAFIVLLTIIGLFIPFYPSNLIASLILSGFLPGYALINLLNLPMKPAEQLLIGIATSYALTITLIMGIVFIGLPLNTLSLAIGLIGLTALFIGLSPKTPPIKLQSIAIMDNFWLTILLVLAAFFRVYQVEYSDYQGDEAGILLQAIAIFQGNLEAILTRFKGPGEVFVLNAIAGLTNNMDELTMRLPFSLASAAAVGLVYLLGRRMFSQSVGLMAAALMVVEGVYVSYARTAQYQNTLLLLSLASLLCFYRYYQLESKPRPLHALGAFLLAVAFLLHFETIFLFPVVFYLTWADLILPHPNPLPKGEGVIFIPPLPLGEGTGVRVKLPLLVGKAWGEGKFFLTRLITCWPSIIIFIIITASFYLPYLLQPSISNTGTYLEGRISSGDSPPFNNFDHFFYYEAFKYNSTYYALMFGSVLLTLAIFSLHRALRSTGLSLFYLIIAVFGLIAISVILVNLGQYRLSAALLAIAIALFFIIVIFSPATPHAQRTLWLWLAPAGWVYLFLVNRPGKHHYLFWSALLLLIALAWHWLARQIQARLPISPRLAWGSLIILALVAWFIFAAHTYMLLLRTDLEYILTYPEHQSPFYPTDPAYPYRTRIGFGYPYRLGWQVIGQLKRNGQFEGSWIANDDGNALIWYMLDTPQTACYPQYIIQSDVTFKGDDTLTVPFQPQEWGYINRYQIWTNNHLRMKVWEFAPDTPPTKPQDITQPNHFPLSIKPSDFPILNRETATPTPQTPLNPPLILGEGSELKLNAPPEYLARAKQLDGRIALLGYDLENQYKTMLPITLYWQTQQTLSLRYKIFVHLIGADGRVWSQADDFPACGTIHANQWGPGQIVLDRHLLKLPPDLPQGDYTLQIGFYEPDLNLRLNYFDIANNEQGNYLSVKIKK